MTDKWADCRLWMMVFGRQKQRISVCVMSEDSVSDVIHIYV